MGRLYVPRDIPCREIALSQSDEHFEQIVALEAELAALLTQADALGLDLVGVHLSEAISWLKSYRVDDSPS